MKVSDFSYLLPESAIAQSAIEPRHDSRLLNTSDMGDHRFLDLPNLLDPGDLVVVNETRVRAARLSGVRPDSGGKVEFLFLENLGGRLWETLARPARRLRPGVVVELSEVSATVIENLGEGLVVVEVDTDQPEAVFEKSGTVPLPPYFTGSLSDVSRYQTVFANRPGSAAAPTAGLHITGEVLDGLRARGVDVASVDLHVSIDTFRPMTVENVGDHVMHSEWCVVPETTAASVAATKEQSRRVVAVGTTVVRTLETYADGGGGVSPGEGTTDLFLVPGSPITVADTLITNFHLPGSTLLVLLETFMGPGWRAVYAAALERGYRFLSFGDAMLCTRLSQY